MVAKKADLMVSRLVESLVGNLAAQMALMSAAGSVACWVVLMVVN